MNLLRPILRTTATTSIAVATAASFLIPPIKTFTSIIPARIPYRRSTSSSSSSVFLLSPCFITDQQSKIKQTQKHQRSEKYRTQKQQKLSSLRKICYPYKTIRKASTLDDCKDTASLDELIQESKNDNIQDIKNRQGEIYIENNLSSDDTKTNYPFTLSNEYLTKKITKIRNILGYNNYDVSLYILSTSDMIELNNDSRGINKSTDILSFPMNEALSPGVIEEPIYPIEEMYTLGEMMICWDYVCDCMDADQEDEYDNDRGISGIMSKMIDNPEDRIVPLLIHGMLHLVGHDHENDDDWELMVEKEEEIWDKVKE